MDSIINNLNYDENNKKHRSIRKILIIIISLSVFVLIWWNLSLILNNPAIPTPMLAFEALVD